MRILRQLESAGLRETDLTESDGAAIALKWLAETDPRELARIERAHPVMVAKVLRQLAQIDEG